METRAQRARRTTRPGIEFVGGEATTPTLLSTVGPAGTVHTLTGVVGQRGSVDGLGPKARLRAPVGLAINAAGTMYLTDGHTVRRLC